MSYILATGLYNEEVIKLTIANNSISNNLNSLSTQSTLNISNLNATSTTIFENLNSLSTQSTLDISNLNSTSNTLLTYINALTNPSILNVNNLNVSQTSIFHGIVTCLSNLIVNDYIQAPQVSLLGVNPSFSMGGNIIGTKSTTTSTLSTSAVIGDMIVEANNGSHLLLQTGRGKAGMYIDTYNNVVINNIATCTSSLNVSGITTLNNANCVSSLNVSGNTTLNNTTIINGNVGIGNNNPLAKLHVSGVIASINDASWDHVRIFNDGATAFFDAGGAESGIAFRIDNGEIGYTSANYSEKMRILANGNVGIGTTQPYNKLEITGQNSTLRVSDYRLLGEPSIEFVKGKENTIDKTFGSDFHTDWRIKTTVDGYMEFYRKRTTGNGNDFDGACVSFSNLGNITCDKVTANNMIKKSLFTFTCSTPITINGSTYYRYDIDLNLYTTAYTRYGTTLLGKTRKFKWMSWLRSGVHNTGYDLDYEISYSYKYSSPESFTVCAYGWPENKSLTSINNSCLLRNTIDCITFVCNVQNTVFYAI